MKNTIIKDDFGYHTYIECLCYDFDHLARLSFFNEDDDDGQFSIEFTASAFPFPDKAYRMPHIWLKKTLFYFKNIWWSIKGRPNKYHTHGYWEIEQAEHIKQFIDYCIEQNNIKERGL